MPVFAVGGNASAAGGLRTFPGEGSTPAPGTGPLYDVTNYFRGLAGKPPVPVPGQLQPFAAAVGGVAATPKAPVVMPMWRQDP